MHLLLQLFLSSFLILVKCFLPWLSSESSVSVMCVSHLFIWLTMTSEGSQVISTSRANELLVLCTVHLHGMQSALG